MSTIHKIIIISFININHSTYSYFYQFTMFNINLEYLLLGFELTL